MMDELLLWGLPASGVITLVVQLLKTLGMAERWAPWACGGLAVLTSVVIGLYRHVPEAVPVLDLVGVAVLLWLTATGIYHAGKNAVA